MFPVTFFFSIQLPFYNRQIKFATLSFSSRIKKYIFLIKRI